MVIPDLNVFLFFFSGEKGGLFYPELVIRRISNTGWTPFFFGFLKIYSLVQSRVFKLKRNKIFNGSFTHITEVIRVIPDLNQLRRWELFHN